MLLETCFNHYSQLPLDKSNKLNQQLEEYTKGKDDIPEEYRRFETKEPDSLEVHIINNYHTTLTFAICFCYFMLTKQYLVSFDFIIAIPFLYQHWKLFGQSPISLFLVFAILTSYGGQFCMWLSWQRRMTDIPNNYWTQVFINSVAWVFILHIVNSRVRQKSIEYQVPIDFYEKEMKPKE